jgi:ABC-type multidrug transport system ATPase subunit
MEEIFVILSYTPTFEQQQLLRDLVFKLKKNNQKVLIISHTHIPEDIIKLADYYFYDSENPLLEVWKHTEGFNFYRNEYFKVESQFDIFRYFNYGLAAYKLVSLGLIIMLKI